MTIGRYFEQKTKELRARQEAEGYARGRAEWLDWRERKEAADARGEPFDEPEPGSEEALRRKREALENSFEYRLKRHWVWPHIMVLFVIAAVINSVALGCGIVWLVRYIAAIEGSGTVFWIVTAGLLLAGTYRTMYKIFRWIYQADD